MIFITLSEAFILGAFSLCLLVGLSVGFQNGPFLIFMDWYANTFLILLHPSIQDHSVLILAHRDLGLFLSLEHLLCPPCLLFTYILPQNLSFVNCAIQVLAVYCMVIEPVAFLT